MSFKTILFITIFAFVFMANGPKQVDKYKNVITKSDAALLIYLTPEAGTLRNQGKSIEIINQNYYKFDLRDFYYLQAVANNGNCQNGCSILLGHFAVNKYTGEVWHYVTAKRIINDKLLQGAQETLRNIYNHSCPN